MHSHRLENCVCGGGAGAKGQGGDGQEGREVGERIEAAKNVTLNTEGQRDGAMPASSSFCRPRGS